MRIKSILFLALFPPIILVHHSFIHSFNRTRASLALPLASIWFACLLHSCVLMQMTCLMHGRMFADAPPHTHYYCCCCCNQPIRWNLWRFQPWRQVMQNVLPNIRLPMVRQFVEKLAKSVNSPKKKKWKL